MNTIAPPFRCRKLIATAMIGALASNFATVCSAGVQGDIAAVTVKYGDLNVSDRQGAAALFRRIRTAGEAVCRALDGSDLGSKMRMDACVQKAIADAVTKVNQPQLSAIYDARSGRQPPATLVSQNR